MKTSERRTRLDGAAPWLAFAALMYASRRKNLRRAALRGLVSLGLTRVLTRIPWIRPHVADSPGLAFAAGVGMEIPAAAPLLSALALVPGVRKEGQPENDASALGLGLAVAFGTTKAWPVAPRLGPVAPKVWLPAHAEPNADGEGLTVVVNKASGPALSESPSESIKKALPKAEVIEVEIKTGDEIRKALDEAVDRGAVALGIAGGDGSINTAAQVALETKKALVVFPAGTFNHLGEALGVTTLVTAVEAVHRGEAVGIDVATIGGQVFLNTASFGSYVALVDAREQLERRVGKWPAVLVALVRVLRDGAPITVEIDGEVKKVWMAFIGNCRYHPSGFAPTWRERMDDGLIDFRYVEGSDPWARTRLILAVLTGRLGRSQVYRQACVKRLALRSLEGPLRLARDGETFEGPEEIIIEKLPERLAVYALHSERP